MPEISHLDLERMEERIVKKIDDLREYLDEYYVRKEEFAPVKSIAYGAVGVVLTAVALAIVAVVLNSAP